MSGELLYDTSVGLIALSLLISLFLATEAGFRAGRSAFSRSDDGGSQVGTIAGAILGLLALLLGFTFAMALSRFDHRKELVVEESNAIGTAFLRSRLLPEPHQTELADLFRRYVELRLEFYNAGRDQDRLRDVHQRTEQMQNELWSELRGAVLKDDREVTTGLFLESLNEVIDLQAKRLAAMENHVPETALFLLFVVSLIAALVVGYGCGVDRKRNLFTTLMLGVLLVLVIAVILDLDRPRRGWIRVSQDSMIRLQQSLAGEPMAMEDEF